MPTEMNRELRRAVVSIAIVLTLAASSTSSMRCPSPVRQHRVKLQEIAKTRAERERQSMINSIYPSLAAVFGSMLIATAVGFVSKKLPRAKKAASIAQALRNLHEIGVSTTSSASATTSKPATNQWRHGRRLATHASQTALRGRLQECFASTCAR